jgi:hypothetical protein
MSPTHLRPFWLALAITLVAVLGPGCGVSLEDDDPETELFKDLTVEGSFFPGGDITITLEYTQQYDAEIEVLCDLIAGDKDLIEVYPTVPTDTPVPEDVATATDVPIPQPQPTVKYKVADLFRERIVSHPDGGPVGEATPAEPATIVRQVQAPTLPGPYVIRCVTPADENNAIREKITVIPFPTETPVPGADEADGA